MPGSLILAHDLGTTGNKATLFDAEGRVLGPALFPCLPDDLPPAPQLG